MSTNIGELIELLTKMQADGHTEVASAIYHIDYMVWNIGEDDDDIFAYALEDKEYRKVLWEFVVAEIDQHLGEESVCFEWKDVTYSIVEEVNAGNYFYQDLKDALTLAKVRRLVKANPSLAEDEAKAMLALEEMSANV